MPEGLEPVPGVSKSDLAELSGTGNPTAYWTRLKEHVCKGVKALNGVQGLLCAKI